MENKTVAQTMGLDKKGKSTVIKSLQKKGYVLAADAALMVGKSPRGLRRLHDSHRAIKRQRVGNDWFYRIPTDMITIHSWFTSKELLAKKMSEHGYRTSNSSIGTLANEGEIEFKRVSGGKNLWRVRPGSALSKIVLEQGWMKRSEMGLPEFEIDHNIRLGNIICLNVGTAGRRRYCKKISPIVHKETQSDRVRQQTIEQCSALSRKDAAYIAGILDTNANIHVNKSKSPSIELRMVFPDLAKWIHAKFPGSTLYESPENDDGKHITMWTCQGTRAYEILKKLLPHLVGKKGISESVIRYVELKKKLSNAKSEEKKCQFKAEMAEVEKLIERQKGDFYLRSTKHYRDRSREKRGLDQKDQK